jgi:hypothetical protein
LLDNNLSTGEGFISNPNEREVKQQLKSYVYTNKFCKHIEDQKIAASKYLDR